MEKEAEKEDNALKRICYRIDDETEEFAVVDRKENADCLANCQASVFNEFLGEAGVRETH